MQNLAGSALFLPQGGTHFQLVPLGSPPRGFHGQIFTPDKPGWIAWHSSRQMNYLSFQKSPDKSQISYFLLCNYIGLFIPVARLESDRLLKHAQSLQLAGDKSHTILPGWQA